MTCLDPNIATDYVHRLLGEDTRKAVEVHLAACAICRRMTAELARESATSSGQPLQDVTEELPPGTAVGRFQIVECIGRGGMGVVYLAFDPELKRDVALKIWLVRADGSSAQDRARDRLLREAQALAQLTHPNVVAIHDVGEFAGEVFIAMELVHGPSLRQWLHSEPRRPTLEILRVFLQAGRGLAAAHRAGLVHRDFKPDNVRLGSDGRARVLDFGLALMDPTAAQEGALSSDGSRTPASTIAGTPGYMAPEQFRSGVVDARADQFAFAVSLRKALTEVGRPRRLPRALERALKKAASPAPSDRFSKLDELLEVIDRSISAPKRRRAAIGVAAVFAVGGAVAWSLAPTTEAVDPCAHGVKSIGSVWNPSVEREIRSRFVDADPQYGPDAWQRIRASFGAFAGAWANEHREACQATRIRGEQSDSALDARMECLLRRQREFAQTVTVLKDADRKLVRRSPRVATSVPDLETCADVDTLLAKVPRPIDAAARDRLHALDDQIAQITALRWAGRYEEALNLGKVLLEQAQLVQWKPTVAEALFHVGYAESAIGRAEEARDHLAAAVYTGIAARHHEMVARAALILVSVVGVDLSRMDDAEPWIRHARAAISALGGGERFTAELENNIGSVRERQGRYTDALTHYQTALSLWRQRFGNDDVTVAAGLNNIGMVHYRMGDLERCKEFLEAAQYSFEEALSADHPFLAYTTGNLGTLYTELGDLERAAKYARRAFEISLAAFGRESQMAMSTLFSLAMVENARGNFERAETTLSDVLETQQKALGRDHIDVAQTLRALGAVTHQRERSEDALRYTQRALRLYRRLAPQSPDVANTQMQLGTILLEQGQSKAARRAFTAAVAIYEPLDPPLAEPLGRALAGLSRAEWALGNVPKSAHHLERALALWRTASPDWNELVGITDWLFTRPRAGAR